VLNLGGEKGVGAQTQTNTCTSAPPTPGDKISLIISEGNSGLKLKSVSRKEQQGYIIL
jgi:hypothetical protein